MFAWFGKLTAGIVLFFSVLLGTAHSPSSNPVSLENASSKAAVSEYPITTHTEPIGETSAFPLRPAATETTGPDASTLPVTSNQGKFYFTNSHTEREGQFNVVVWSEYLASPDASIPKYSPGTTLTLPATFIVAKSQNVAIQGTGGKMFYIRVTDIGQIQTTEGNSLHVIDVVKIATDSTTSTSKIYNGGKGNLFPLPGTTNGAIDISVVAVGDESVILKVAQSGTLFD